MATLRFQFGSTEIEVPAAEAAQHSGLASEVMVCGGRAIDLAAMVGAPISQEFARRFANLFGQGERLPMPLAECEAFLALADYIQAEGEGERGVEGVVDVLLQHIAAGRLPAGPLAYRQLFKYRPAETGAALGGAMAEAYRRGALPTALLADAVAVLGPEYALAFKPLAYPFIPVAGFPDPERAFTCDPLAARAAPDYAAASADLVSFHGMPGLSDAPRARLVAPAVAWGRIAGVLPGMPWRTADGRGGVLLGGGFPSLCLAGNWAAFEAECDLDLFVWGADEAARRGAFSCALEYLAARGAAFETLHSVVRAVLPGMPEVQLINSDVGTPLEVLANFDASHIQAGWDGERFICTPEWAFYSPRGQSLLVRHTVRYHRLLKLVRRGWEPVTLQAKVLVLPARRSWASVYLAPGFTLRVWASHEHLLAEWRSAEWSQQRTRGRLWDALPNRLWRVMSELGEGEHHFAVSALPAYGRFSIAGLPPGRPELDWAATSLADTLAIPASATFRNGFSRYVEVNLAPRNGGNEAVFLRGCRLVEAGLSDVRRDGVPCGSSHAEWVTVEGTPSAAGGAADLHAPGEPGPAVTITATVMSDTVLDEGDQCVDLRVISGRTFNCLLTRCTPPWTKRQAHLLVCCYLQL